MGNKNFTWEMIDNLCEEIADLADEAKASEAFQSWLKVQTAFHKYSWNNTALIYIQSNRHGFKASKVMGAKKWQTLDRKVKGDQWRKKLWILAPIFKKDEETGESRIAYFRNVYVFDVSQTEGKPLPKLEYRVTGDDSGLVAALEAEYKRRNISLEYVEDLGGARGASYGGKVKILTSLEGAERAATLAHELAHEILHWEDDGKLAPNHTRSAVEIEAESAAMVIMGAWGLEYKPGAMYLASWQGDKAKVKESMKAIVKASKSVLEAILTEGKESETKAA